MHAFGDFVSAALQYHVASPSEMNADIGSIELFLHDERRVGDECFGFLAAKVFVIVCTFRAE